MWPAARSPPSHFTLKKHAEVPLFFAVQKNEISLIEGINDSGRVETKVSQNAGIQNFVVMQKSLLAGLNVYAGYLKCLQSVARLAKGEVN